MLELGLLGENCAKNPFLVEIRNVVIDYPYFRGRRHFNNVKWRHI